MNDPTNESPAGPSCDLKSRQSVCDLPENRWRPPTMDGRFALLATGLLLAFVGLGFTVSRYSLVAIALWMLTYLFG